MPAAGRWGSATRPECTSPTTKDARSKPLLKTALEECIHWVTRAGDASRDLQDLAFRMIVEILGCNPGVGSPIAETAR